MVRISSGSNSNQSYGTPQYIFDFFNRYERFTLDAAASEENAKCPLYFTKEQNGLLQSWKDHRVWINPPYNDVESWVDCSIEKIYRRECLSVHLLLNLDCSTNWFKKLYNCHVYRTAYLIDHRIKFDGASNSQSVSSVCFALDVACPMKSMHFQLVSIPRQGKVK